MCLRGIGRILVFRYLEFERIINYLFTFVVKMKFFFRESTQYSVNHKILELSGLSHLKLRKLEPTEMKQFI